MEEIPKTEFNIRESIIQKSFWIKVGIFILVMVAVGFLGSLLFMGIAAVGGMPLESMGQVFDLIEDKNLKPYLKAGIGVNHFVIFTCGAIAFASIVYGSLWKKYFRFAAIDYPMLSRIFLLLVVSYPIIAFSAMLLDGVELPEWMNQMDESNMEAMMSMLQMDNVLDLLVNLLIVAILPAIGEELLFRGVIQNELVKKLANPHVAILVASIIFSGVHMQVVGFLPKLVIGLILGYAYYWTKSLWYPMILHFFNNAMSTIMLYLGGDELEAQQAAVESPDWRIMGVLVIISSFLCYVVINNILSHLEPEERENA